MKKRVFFCVLILVVGLNLTSCTPQPLLHNPAVQDTGGEEGGTTDNPNGKG